MTKNFDVVIVGGGVIGSATAYFLSLNPDFFGRIAVVERDPSYAKSATALSAASIRQQFSAPVNIEISKFGIEFLRRSSETLAVDEQPVDIALHEAGYMYLASLEGLYALTQNIAVQKAHDIPVRLLDPDALAERFPWLNTCGIAAASITDAGEGWFDAYGLLQAFRRKARALGVTYITAEATGFTRNGTGRIDRVQLSTGDDLGAGHVVLSAGTRTPGLAALMGINLPVAARKRHVFVFDCKTEIKNCPLVIDPSGLYFRPEGKFFICGLPPSPDPDVDVDDFTVDHSLFDEAIWPILAERVPAFETIKMTNAWAGHYDYNKLDQNAIIGPMPDIQNLLIASGFSGHGLQQAPAAGRGLAELIIHNSYRTLDLSTLHYDRLYNGNLLIENNII
jgi:glycine/D-amino acid oxidase-like deaminating enzyme